MKPIRRSIKKFWVAGPLVWLTGLLLCWFLLPLRPLPRDTIFVVMTLITAVYAAVIILRYFQRVHAERNIENLLQREVDRSLDVESGLSDKHVLREGLNHAITLLRASRSAGGGGASALYDLPWYLVLGMSNSGKTSLLTRSGLSASVAGNRSGLLDNGTQHCDWYFSADAVLIDTAGRYLHDDQSASEFADFLRLLKKQRSKPAINGLVLVVSLPEVISATIEDREDLAARLVSRIDEYTACLAVNPPIYLMLSKTDQFPGFNQAFEGLGLAERQQPLGMTFLLSEILQFGLHKVLEEKFADLLGRIRQHINYKVVVQGETPTAELLQFPNYFSELFSVLAGFLEQFERSAQGRTPLILRGIYFTSALQTDRRLPAVYEDYLGEAYALDQDDSHPQEVIEEKRVGDKSYFITDTFRRVIFPDRDLSLAYSRFGRTGSLGRRLMGVALALGVGLLVWEGISFQKNRIWLASVERDLNEMDQAEGQDERVRPGQSVEWLRRHLVEIEGRRDKGNPFPFSAKLYSEDAIYESLQHAYLQQLRAQVLEPIGKQLQVQLRDLSDSVQIIAGDSASNAAKKALRRDANGNTGPDLALNASATAGFSLSEEVLGRLNDQQVASLVDAYNGLKLYLILSQPGTHADVDFVAAELPTIWAKVASANGQHVSSTSIADNTAMYVRYLRNGKAPTLHRNEQFITDARRNLKSFMVASSLADREYLRLQLEFSRHYPALTLGDLVPLPGRNQLFSTEAVPAIFTRRGWDEFFKPELIKLFAADLHNESDWVIDGDGGDSLIQKANLLRELLARYKADYANAWFNLLEGTGVRHFTDMDNAAQRLTLLSDVQNSPVKTLLAAVNHNTNWDVPERTDSGVQSKVEDSLWAPFNDGSLSKRFDPVSRLFTTQNPEGADSTIMDRYLATLRKLKVRLTNIQRSQDVGKNSKLLISETLEGQPSEVTTARNYVETSIETSKGSLSDSLHRLFNSPLQFTWETLRVPAGQQVAKAWSQQIAQPWKHVMAHRYPIVPTSNNEASVKDLLRFVHPESGLLATFKRNEIGNLTGGEGLSMSSNGKSAPLVSSRVVDSIAKGNSVGQVIASLSDRENGFEIMLEPSARYTDIVFTLDGQVQHYRNGKSIWGRFTWPGASNVPGARLDVITLSGERVTVFDYPGRWGLLKMNDSALVTNIDEVRQRFTWPSGSGQVSLVVRNYGGVKMTDLANVKLLDSLGDAGRSNK